jgi:hypothetical protein
MIITDVNGGKLSLTKTRLREVTGEAVPGNTWSVNLVDLKAAFQDQPVLYRTDEMWGDLRGHITYSPKERVIGCRTFDAENFAVILKAIKEAVKK